MKCSSCAFDNNVFDMEEATISYLGELCNGNYVIVENVPCYKCPNCGEEFFTLSVSEKLEKIIKSFDNNDERVYITDYDAAA